MTYVTEGLIATSQPTNANGGSLDVKVKFQDDIRRFNLADASSLALLRARVQTLFAIPAEAAMTLLYQDDENDLITMSFEEELFHAIQISRGMLRLHVRIDGVTVPQVHRRIESPERKHGKSHEGLPKRVKLEKAPTFERPERESGDRLKARHVKDVTIPDRTVVLPGVPFCKVWRLRNVGGEWPAMTRLVFVSHKGDHMGGPEFVPVQGPVAPNAEIDVSVNLVAPKESGDYIGFWRMATEDGKRFGQRLRVSITVPGNSSSDDSGKELVAVPSEYEQLCKQVEALGFDVPKRRVERLLRKFGGNVDTVAQTLASRNNKRGKRVEQQAPK